MRKPDGETMLTVRSELGSATTSTGTIARVALTPTLHFITVPRASPGSDAMSATMTPAARRFTIHAVARRFRASEKQGPRRAPTRSSSRRKFSASRCACRSPPRTSPPHAAAHVRTGDGKT
jgi:hypothetical protein